MDYNKILILIMCVYYIGFTLTARGRLDQQELNNHMWQVASLLDSSALRV